MSGNRFWHTTYSPPGPTYEELLAKCDLTSPPDPFEEQWMSLPEVGEEIIRDN